MKMENTKLVEAWGLAAKAADNEEDVEEAKRLSKKLLDTLAVDAEDDPHKPTVVCLALLMLANTFVEHLISFVEGEENH